MLLRDREDTLLVKLRLMLRREQKARTPDPDCIAVLEREIERLVQQSKERPKAGRG
jgi:hypothetical protein